MRGRVLFSDVLDVVGKYQELVASSKDQGWSTNLLTLLVFFERCAIENVKT